MLVRTWLTTVRSLAGSFR